MALTDAAYSDLKQAVLDFSNAIAKLPHTSAEYDAAFAAYSDMGVPRNAIRSNAAAISAKLKPLK